MPRTTLVLGLLVTSVFPAVVHGGVTVPFTEQFEDDASNWYDAFGGAPVTWVAGGGPGGASDAYVSTDFAFADAGPMGTVLFRGEDGFMSSDDAFFGDWIAGGVTELRFSFRHDAPAPVPLFARFTGPANIGAIGLIVPPVAPNTWTELSVPITPDNPNFVFEGPIGFGDVFSNIAHLQIGMAPPMGFENDPTPYTFDLDAISIIPAPGGLAVLLVAGAGAPRRRRRRIRLLRR